MARDTLTSDHATQWIRLGEPAPSESLAPAVSRSAKVQAFVVLRREKVGQTFSKLGSSGAALCSIVREIRWYCQRMSSERIVPPDRCARGGSPVRGGAPPALHVRSAPGREHERSEALSTPRLPAARRPIRSRRLRRHLIPRQLRQWWKRRQ